MGRLDGKICIVTGAASGIGLATAKRLGAEGARVVLADLNAEKAEAAAGEVRAGGAPGAWASVCDVSQQAQVAATVSGAFERFGRLDVVVNNAGLMVFKPLEEHTADDWLRILHVDSDLRPSAQHAGDAAPAVADVEPEGRRAGGRIQRRLAVSAAREAGLPKADGILQQAQQQEMRDRVITAIRLRAQSPGPLALFLRQKRKRGGGPDLGAGRAAIDNHDPGPVGIRSREG